MIMLPLALSDLQDPRLPFTSPGAGRPAAGVAHWHYNLLKARGLAGPGRRRHWRAADPGPGPMGMGTFNLS
jgi:hypothetical protein